MPSLTRIPLVSILPFTVLLVACPPQQDPECRDRDEGDAWCLGDDSAATCVDGDVQSFDCLSCGQGEREVTCTDEAFAFYQVDVLAMGPEAGQTGVALDVIPAIQLDVPIYLPEGVDVPGVTFTVDGEGVAGMWGYSDEGTGATSTVWGFVPDADLAPNTEYRVELSDQFKVDPDTLDELGYLDGGFATGPQWWVFTTGDAVGSIPTLIDTEPTFNSTLGSPIAPITATFSRPIAPASLNESTMYVEEPSGLLLDGTLQTDGSTVIFTPDSELDPLTNYDVTITTGLTDTDGNTIDAPVQWRFTTVGTLQVTGMTPSSGSTNVSIDTELSLSFNVPLDPSTVTNDTVQPRADRTVENMSLRTIDVDVTVNGNTLRFIPTVGDWQEYETGYTVRLDRNLRGINGERLDYGNNFTFETPYFDANRSYTVHTVASGRSTSMDLNSSDAAVFTSDVGGSSDSRWYFDAYQGNWIIKSEGTGDGEALAVRVDGSPQEMVSVPSSNIDPRQQWLLDPEGGQPGFSQQRGESPGVVYIKTPWFGDQYVLTGNSSAVSLDPPQRRTNQLFWFKRRL